MKFLITAAGSGGHIYPALSLANELKGNNVIAEIVFLCTKKSIDKKIFKDTKDRVVKFDFVSPSSRTGVSTILFCLKNLNFLLKFIIESIKVFFFILDIKPDVIIGFGGVGSIAAIISAKILNIPSLIHEQNVVPGLANRLLGRFSSKVATGFRKSDKYFKNSDVIFTGNPIRPDLERLKRDNALLALDLDIKKFTILVVGGSQGASFVNNSFVNSVIALSPEKRSRLQIIHCCGNKDVITLKNKYKECKIQAKVFDFCTQMSSAYSSADLIIGRAGAGTINEICFFAKASILIPYPYAQAHQNANAGFMQESQAATVVKQDELTCNHLTSLINISMDHPALLKSMGGKSQKLYRDNCASRLRETIMEIIMQKK